MWGEVMENKSLRQLGFEYDAAIKTIDFFIEKTVQRRNKAHKQGRKNEEFKAKQWINDLRRQKREMQDIATKLKHYYRTSVVNKPQGYDDEIDGSAKSGGEKK